MDESGEKRYEALSPFELKNKLIEMAGEGIDHAMLNAGRGNPNWVADSPRLGFFRLGFFALEEAKRVLDQPGFGGSPRREGVAERFDAFVAHNPRAPGADFLRDAVRYAHDVLDIDRETFLFELVDGILGDHYPVPDRMFRCSEKVVRAYLDREMCGGSPPAGSFELFAVEGGTAAMAYVFTSLMENRLLHKGDTIALGSPIFTPYLEIPRLNDFEFIELEIRQSEDRGWQYPDEEIDRLTDDRVKAFFLVHPSNPTSVAMHEDTLARIADVVNTRRRDLILLTDDVYATFVNGFRSLAAVCPQNTILVYSYSKYFGATGWRLGVIGVHEDNVFDKKIAGLPENDRAALRKRYGTVTPDPDGMKLVDRMVADSRAVALNHTAGLSGPQQVMMALFSLHALLDNTRGGAYKKGAQAIVRRRLESLYEGVGIPCPEDAWSARYYTTIDVPRLAAQRFCRAFADDLVKNNEPIDFVWRLAEEKSIVLMDGGGFDAPNMSIRVSLANLPDEAYREIGRGVSELLDEYHRRWQATRR